MIFPIRCFTCNKVLAGLWKGYDERVNKKGEKIKDVLDDMKVNRYCCRRMFIGHVELIDTIIHYYHQPQENIEE